MPPKVEPTPEQFEKFSRAMEKYGFERIGAEEFRQIFRNKHLRSPRKTKGKEVGFRYSANDLEAWVWTSWISKENKIRDEDLGWALITMHGKRKYTDRPALRTKNFLSTMLIKAWFIGWRVHTRPKCKVCSAWYYITPGPHPKQRYWKRYCRCINNEDNPRFLRWNFNKDLMPIEAQKYLDRRYKKRARDRRREKKEGRPKRRAYEIRRPWGT